MQAKATVTVTRSGVWFSDDCFSSHERITGFCADALSKGTGSLASRAYMAWVQAALGNGATAEAVPTLAADGQDC